MNLDQWIHVAELLVIVACSPIVWKLNRGLNRYLSEREEYPPHRHIGPTIVYPRGLKPDPLNGKSE
jgi:hypothetical protein